MAKLIAVANVKGGVGKTTIAIALAHYLVDMGHQVGILDADMQQSAYRLRTREMAANPDAIAPWPVWPISDSTQLQQVVEKMKDVDATLIVDCPGSLRDPILKDLFRIADALLVPVSYDQLTADASIEFTRMVRPMTSATIAFVPNKIRTGVRYDAESQVRNILLSAGRVLPRIKEGVAIQRISTLTFTDYQKKAIQYTVEDLQNIIKTK